ncbi:MAG: hypothetical protein A3F16_00170 [Deltaproteobacteria bacterium RIFCSPHIGHO2_12_FULL_43_9]|nr:MAG: hypothetical protein A3F16_00170 [Deltaproteobacteria bacterium RIFCSPHIGHO2_12_FULL_43_9]
MKKIKFILILAIAIMPFSLQAGEYERNVQKQNNNGLEKATERAGLFLNFKGLNPASPLGIMGMTVGLEGTAGLIGLTSTDGKLYSQQLIPLARLYAAKGLPLGIDIEFSLVHSSILKGLGLIDPDFFEVSIYGGGVKYSFLNEENEDPISLAGRVTYTRGAFETLLLNMYGTDVLLSKKVGFDFLSLTPYLGAGALLSQFNIPLPGNPPNRTLRPRATSLKLIGGLATKFLLTKIVGEVNYSPETTTASILLSIDL